MPRQREGNETNRASEGTRQAAEHGSNGAARGQRRRPAARAMLGGLPFSFSGSVRLVAGLVLGHRGHALVLVSSLVCQDAHGVQRGGA